MPESVADRQKKAQAVSSSRVLGPEEFKLLQQRQALREVEGMKSGGKGRKRKREGEAETERYVTADTGPPRGGGVEVRGGGGGGGMLQQIQALREVEELKSGGGGGKGRKRKREGQRQALRSGGDGV